MRLRGNNAEVFLLCTLSFTNNGKALATGSKQDDRMKVVTTTSRPTQSPKGSERMKNHPFYQLNNDSMDMLQLDSGLALFKT